MKKVFSLLLILTLIFSSVSAGAVSVVWSDTKVQEGTLTATVSGISEGDRVVVRVLSDGVFSSLNMAWSEGDSASVDVEIGENDDTANVFVWEQTSMKPLLSSSIASEITTEGIKDTEAIFSDNQLVNNADAIGYRTVDLLTDKYSVSFDLTVNTKGDNAIMLGDSSNGTLGYGESSAILQFNGDNFTTRRGDGTGGYSEAAVTLCAVELGKTYKVIIQGSVTTNTFNVIIYDGDTKYVSDTMKSRTNATSGIDTIAFVNNSKNAVVTEEGYVSNYNFVGTNLEIASEHTETIQTNTYEGFEGLYYGLEVVSTGKYARGNSGKLTADYSSVSDTSAMFIPRDMGDGSHAFVCKSSSNRITTTGESGVNLTSAGYVPTDNTQHWVLEESENYSEDNLTYYFKHIDSGNYIGLSGSNLALVTSSNKQEIRLVPQKDESLLYLISQLSVYNLLTDAQRERLETVYESVAGDIFGRYGGYSEWTPRIRMDNMFTEILDGTLTEAEQLTLLENFLNSTNGYLYSGQASYQAISSSLPDTEGLYWTVDEGTAGSYDFWSGTYLDGMLYTYQIFEADGTLQQTISLYVEDNSTAQTNAETYKNVLIQIPYAFRQYLNTVKIRNDSANYYNGGGTTMYVRINWTPDSDNMKSTVVHELGHIVDANNGYWASGSGWSAAISSDMYHISTYGSSNATEDFAEFSRLYFASYGNADMQKGLEVMFPARYASFGRLRQNNLGGWGLWEDDYTS